MNIKKLVQRLKKCPAQSTVRRYNVIACTLDKKGRTIAVRMNDYERTHPLQKYFAEKVGRPEAIFLHAEISALIASRDKEVHTIIVARIDAHGNPVNAAPCTICQEALKAYGVQNIIHT